MELVNEWSPTEKNRKYDTPFRTDSTCEKELMAALKLTGNALRKAEMEYNAKFGHTLGWIQNIAPKDRIEFFYIDYHLATQIVAHTLPGFKGLKRCIKYLASNPHKPTFYPYNSYDGSNFIRLTWSGNKFEYYTTNHCLECHQDKDHTRILNIIRLV